MKGFSTTQPRPNTLLCKATSVARIAALMTLAAGAPAEDEWEPSNYQQRFEAPKAGIRLQDNNVWVYKRSFAERFGMPARWIDDKLEGAEAVAYRVAWSSLKKCGFFGELNNCRPIEHCVLDLYVSDKDSKSLPWKTKNSRNFIRYESSSRFLTAQNRKDASTWDPEKEIWDISRANIGLDSVSWVSGPPNDGKVYSASSSAVSVAAYDQTIFEGLDYLKLDTDCNFAERKEHVRVFFTEKFPKPTDYGFRYVGDSLVASPKDEARFEKAEREWYERKAKGDVPHLVTLPNGYMARVQKHHRTVFTPRSLATEVERRANGPNTK